MGAALAVVAAGVLIADQRLAPTYPFLLIVLIILASASAWELVHLLPPAQRPSPRFCCAAVAVLIAANWPAHVWYGEPWVWVVGTFTAIVLSAFVVEMIAFQGPGEAVMRMALTVWVIAYLGLLPSFFAQLRWLDGLEGEISSGTLALTLAIFVPKCCDIGAYFTGRLIGRHLMTPVLSPKKTWEGLAGGMVAAMVTAVGIGRLRPILGGSDLKAVGFGLTVGLAGVLGDLAESLIKRDCQKKDAAQTVPGFGGVLDVVDAVLFAAPVAYWWLH
jgi:phosphatidate cytidylyltransferase